MAGIIKDAGDDPDVTHGATIISTVFPAPPGTGIVFQAGEGVGTVTRPGLQIQPGEAAINPTPRRMMTEICEQICAEYGLPADLVITISVPGGEEIAQKTWNPRLGIVGGISILGTTGVVHPFSCSAWIHSIHRGIDVARAEKQNMYSLRPAQPLKTQHKHFMICRILQFSTWVILPVAYSNICERIPSINLPLQADSPS